MPEVPHDATVALRLELGRMTDKANALEAALRKEVLIVIREVASENARLKAEVESLKKPAIIGGYNISEYIRMANSETLEFDNGDIFADMTLPERIKYIVESHARLKADVRNCHTAIRVKDEENARLKAEVERLTDENVTLRMERMQDETGKRITYADYARLKAEVERLRKAGDGLHAFLINYIVDNRISSAYLNKLDDGWTAAKEGKPSDA